jgi:hypothetical protein
MPGMGLEDRLTDIFAAIADEYDKRPEHRRERLLHLLSLGHQGFNGWDESLPQVTRDDLDELRDEGVIDIDYGSHGEYLVRPTLTGRRLLRRYRRELARVDRAEPVDLSWATVRPVLHAAVDAWSDAGAPTSGHVGFKTIASRLGSDENDLGLVRAAELLAIGDWLDLDYDENDRAFVRPTMRGVMATRGWPGGDGEVAAERFLSVLDEIASSSSADDTQRGWAARARDTLMEVGTKTLAEVVSRSVGNAV